MMIHHCPVAPPSSPGCIPRCVPGVVHVQGKVVSADIAQVGDGGFVPSLDTVVVGWLVEKLKTDDVRDRGEEGR